MLQYASPKSGFSAMACAVLAQRLGLLAQRLQIVR
jgi:hypothetical protein